MNFFTGQTTLTTLEFPITAYEKCSILAFEEIYILALQCCTFFGDFSPPVICSALSKVFIFQKQHIDVSRLELCMCVAKNDT